MSQQIVVFKLGDQEYGIDIMRVIEIDNDRKVRPVPEVPSYIEGLVKLRDEIYPIYNLRERFRMPRQTDHGESKIVYMNLEEIQIGFRVDNVCEILTIQEQDVEETPEMIARYDSKYIKGITKQDERMILLLDVDLLVSEEDQQAIEEIM